jgi:protein involved in temperature-dependent protein secretion
MQGQWDQVVAVRRQMVREAPGVAGVRANFALLLEEHGDWGDASREYQVAAQRLGVRP